MRGLHFEHAVSYVQHRNVEGSTAEVKDQHRLLLATLVQAVRERRGRGLVHDSQHFEPGNLTGLFGRGALGVIEVGGNRDDRLAHRIAQVRLGVSLQLLQDAGRNLLRGVLGTVNVDGPVLAHVALHRADRALGVGDRLTLRHLTDENLAGLGKSNHGRGRATTFGVGNYNGLARLQHTDHRVGGSEVYTDCLCHELLLSCFYVSDSPDHPGSENLYVQ